MDSNTSNNSGTNFNDGLVPPEEGAPLTPDSTPAPSLATDATENGSLGTSLDPANFGGSSIDIPSDPSPLDAPANADDKFTKKSKDDQPKQPKEPMPKSKLIAIIVTAANLLICASAVIACIVISNNNQSGNQDPDSDDGDEVVLEQKCEALKCIEEIALSDTTATISQKLGINTNIITADFTVSKDFSIRVDHSSGSPNIALHGKYSNLPRSSASTATLEKFTQTLDDDYQTLYDEYLAAKQAYDNAPYNNKPAYPQTPESSYDLAKTQEELGEGILIEASSYKKTYIWVSKDKDDNHYLELNFSTESGMCKSVSSYSKAKVEEFTADGFGATF